MSIEVFPKSNDAVPKYQSLFEQKFNSLTTSWQEKVNIQGKGYVDFCLLQAPSNSDTSLRLIIDGNVVYSGKGISSGNRYAGIISPKYIMGNETSNLYTLHTNGKWLMDVAELNPDANLIKSQSTFNGPHLITEPFYFKESFSIEIAADYDAIDANFVYAGGLEV